MMLINPTNEAACTVIKFNKFAIFISHLAAEIGNRPEMIVSLCIAVAYHLTYAAARFR